MSPDQTQLPDGTWTPSIPEPLWVGWRLRQAQCECGETFRGRQARERYEAHWRTEHMPVALTGAHRDLSEAESGSLIRGTCPGCKDTGGFLAGPEGGTSKNWECPTCGARFNIGFTVVGELILAELIRDSQR